MKLLLAFVFLVLIFTDKSFTTPIFCFGAICRYSCRTSHQGHRKCDGSFNCTCTWPC
ncbi:hypothetical protein AMTRI_Chr09g38830 [Amborella trichopoda]